MKKAKREPFRHLTIERKNNAEAVAVCGRLFTEEDLEILLFDTRENIDAKMELVVFAQRNKRLQSALDKSKAENKELRRRNQRLASWKTMFLKELKEEAEKQYFAHVNSGEDLN